MNTLNELLQDNSGGTSSLRLAFLVTILLPALAWFALSLYSKQLLDFPPGVLAFLGMGWGAKVGQRFAEKAEQPPIQKP